MRKAVVAAVAVALAFAELALAGPVSYRVDAERSAVSFSIRHFVSDVPGRFGELTGTIVLDEDSPARSRVELTVLAASIDTGNEERDRDLRSANFFEVARFPTLTFTSTAVRPVDADTLEVTGDLTIRGVTQRITIPVDRLDTAKTSGGERVGFEARFTINRKDYGIVWDRVMDSGPILGDDVKIMINVEAVRLEPPEGSRRIRSADPTLVAGRRPAMLPSQ